MSQQLKQSTGLKTREGKSSKLETKGFYPMSKDCQLQELKCPLCGKKFRGYGNNTRPFDIKGRVCDECNINVIIPMRVMAFYPQQRA